MKRIPTQKNGFWKRFFINIPFVLMVALMIAFFGGAGLLIFYSIVVAVAFDSAMIYLIVAGAGIILLGLGLIFIPVYQKYYAFYNKKMGWKFVDDKPTVQKTVTYSEKTASVREFCKKYITVSNVAIGVLALGSVFAIISAALGCIDRSNWVRDIGGFREERGYYTDVRNEPVKYDITGKPVKAVNVIQATSGDRKKEIILVYSTVRDRQGFVEISGYKKFENDFSSSRKSLQDGDELTVSVSEAPKLTGTLDKLLFFIFDDYSVEKQIFIYIPYAERDEITVDQADKILLERIKTNDDGSTTVVIEPYEKDN